MKQLTIKEDLKRTSSLNDIIILENVLKIKFPLNLKELIIQYEGCTVEENVFFSEKVSSFFPINQFLYLCESHIGGASIEAIYNGHFKDGITEFIPFAIDPGGWDYNISINQKSFGEIWLNPFDNGNQEYSFVASSLEEFINGLISEDEAMKKGY